MLRRLLTLFAAIAVLSQARWPSDYAAYNLAARRTVGLRELAEIILALTGSQAKLNLGTGEGRNRELNVTKIHRDFALPETNLEASGQ